MKKLAAVIAIGCMILIFFNSCKTVSYQPVQIGVTTPSFTWNDSSVCVAGKVYSNADVNQFLAKLKSGIPMELGGMIVTLRLTAEGKVYLDWSYCYKHK